MSNLIFYLLLKLSSILRWSLTPFILIITIYAPKIKNRIDFENNNSGCIFSKSFKLIGVKADIAFEISSEGELEQIMPIFNKVIKSGKNVELLFFSESVERKCLELGKRFPNLRIYRIPFLTYSIFSNSSRNVNSWITSDVFVLCRYDFFPELLLYGMKLDVTFILLSATLKGKSVVNKKCFSIQGWFLRQVYKSFDKIIAATQIDKDKLKFITSKDINIDVCDFRNIQIINRQKESEQALTKYDFYNYFSSAIKNITIGNRIIMGSYYANEAELFANENLLDMILSKKVLALIAPHSLSDNNIRQIKINLKAVYKQCCNDLKIPIYVINSQKLDYKKMFEEFNKSPGIIILQVPGILCEIYSLFGSAYVGGGFNKSIHSVLEPYWSTCNIFCGPKTHRSTEFDFAKSNSPKYVQVVNVKKEFSEMLSFKYSEDEMNLRKKMAEENIEATNNLINNLRI